MSGHKLELRSVTFVEVSGQTAHYTAEFEALWQGARIPFNIHVKTTEGWESAVHLACLQVKNFGSFLAAEADHLKTGPHVPGTMN